MTGVRLAGLVALIVALAFGASLWLERRPIPPSAEMAVAAKVDAIAVHDAAKAETVYVAAKAVAAATRADYRATRDSALRDLTDTVLTKRAFAKADTFIVHDTVMSLAADTALAREKTVTADVRAELAIAMRPRPAPRLGLVLTALYDPVARNPLVSASAGLRVIGNVSLIVVAYQKVQLGEAPRVFFGLSVRL